MHPANSDLDMIRHIIDSIERDRALGRFRDKQIQAIHQQSNQLAETCQQLSERVSSLELDFRDVKHKVDRQVEQEYLSHPHSLDGQAICNYKGFR